MVITRERDVTSPRCSGEPKCWAETESLLMRASLLIFSSAEREMRCAQCVCAKTDEEACVCVGRCVLQLMSVPPPKRAQPTMPPGKKVHAEVSH